VIEQVKVTLVESENEKMKRFLKDKVTAIRSGLQELQTNKVVMWRKTYEATPAMAVREFPFHNASNIVIPVAAIHSDTLLARVMAAVFKTQPLWVAKIIGEHDEARLFEKMRIAFEEHMQYIGIEPSELDLYRVYHEWMGETIRFGTSTVKCPRMREVEDVATSSSDGLGKADYYRRVRYSGSRPEKIPFTDFGLPPNSKTVENARFKYHCIRYQWDELEERAWMGIYDRTAVNKMKGHPDRTSPNYVAQMQEQDAGARTQQGYETGTYGYAEYDVYECHYTYKLGRRYVQLMAWYNPLNDQILRIYHKYYPDDIFVAARLFYRDDFFFGYGFCETLSMLQEEVSTIHNQRRDNATIAMNMFRADPDSELQKGFRTFPGCLIPAKKDEFEAVNSGQPNQMSVEEEQLTLELAEKRSGVSAPIQGMGSGVMSKRGVYSSMGTLSLLQEGNTRTDLNITDIRYAHTKLGRIIARQESEFGADDEERFRKYGKMGVMVQQALQLYKRGLLTLPVYASTASVNREVEKQADLMLSGLMQKHHQMIAQMLGAASNQFAPPEIKGYMTKAVESANALMQQVFRHFGYDEVTRYVPDVPEMPTKVQWVGALGGQPPVPGNGQTAHPGAPLVPNGVTTMPAIQVAGNPTSAILQNFTPPPTGGPQ